MSKGAMSGRDFVNLVCETLGVDPGKRVRAVGISASCKGCVEVTLSVLMTSDEAKVIAAATSGQRVSATRAIGLLPAATSKPIEKAGKPAITPVSMTPKKLTYHGDIDSFGPLLSDMSAFPDNSGNDLPVPEFVEM